MVAKRRKTSRKNSRARKEAPVEHELPGGFWRQISAILMIALALFFIITWFGHGGSVLNMVHKFFESQLGVATFFLPLLLVYIGVRILKSENNRIAIPVYFASILMILWVSGIGAIWNNGGSVGKWLNGVFTNLLDQGVVIFIYIVLIFITTAFILQVSPITLFKGTKNMVTPGKKEFEKDTDDKKLGQIEIKVNSGLGSAAVATAAK